jgi:hypothetical protein
MYAYVKLSDVGQLKEDFRNLLWTYAQLRVPEVLLVLWLVGLRKCGRLEEPGPKKTLPTGALYASG